MISGHECGLVHWRYYAFCTPTGGRPVQDWFDSLLDDERDELTDTLAYLQHLRIDQWEYPKFKHLGKGLSEIRAAVSALHSWIRVYGTFGPKGQRFAYTFLFGTVKKEKNDKHGKQEAQRNKHLLDIGEANIHEFEFSGEPNRSAATGKAKAIPIR